MMGLYLDCVDVKELWVLEMKKNVPYELSFLIVNTTDKLYLTVPIPEMLTCGKSGIILETHSNLILHLI